MTLACAWFTASPPSPELTAEQIRDASTAGTLLWDSVNAVVLVSVCIEEEFGLEVPPEDLDRLSSFQAILDYLVERTGSGATIASGSRCCGPSLSPRVMCTMEIGCERSSIALLLGATNRK